MREIITVIKGNFRKNKGSYISITLLMLVVSLAITAVFSIIINTNERDTSAMEEVGFGHILAAIDYQNDMQGFDEYEMFCLELAENIDSKDYVGSVDLVRSLFLQIMDVNGSEGNSTTWTLPYEASGLHYRIYDENDKELENFTLNAGEIIVPVSFKTLYDTRIGDTVTLGKEKEEDLKYKIAAYMEDPYMGSSIMGIKTLLISDEDFSRIFEKYTGSGFILSIFKDEISEMSDVEFEKKLNQGTQYSGYSWITLSRTQAYSYMTMLTNIFSGILVAFMVLLVIATLIVLNHNINSSIEQDYVNLGILKAVGITNNMIKLSFISGYMIFVIIGAAFGILVSIPVIALVNRMIRPSVGLYIESTPALFESVTTLAVIFIVIVLFVLCKLRKISKISPVSAINGGRKDVHFSSLFKLPISKRALDASLAYRHITSGKKQYIGAVLITVILTFFMVVISDMCICFSNEDKINEMFSPVVYDMCSYATTDEDWEEKMADVESIIGKYTDYTKYIYGSQYVVLNDTQIWCGIMSEPDLIKNVYDGRTCTYDNEILITEYMTENYGIEIGDEVTIGLNGKFADFIVTGYYQCTNDMGKNITMSLDGYYKIAGEPKEGSRSNYCYDLEENEFCDKICEEITAKYTEDEVRFDGTDDWNGTDPVISALYGITVLIYILSGVFVAITVVLVCVKMFVKERQDYGIYKALGFTSAKLRRQFAARFVICALLGSVIGIICTLLFSDAMVNVILEMFGMYNFSSSLSLAAAMVPVIFMSVVYYLFSYAVSRKIKKVTPRILINE